MAGADCPNCEKKGTVFRCPRRHADNNDCKVCVNCTMSNLMKIDDDGTFGAEGCRSMKPDAIEKGLDPDEWWKTIPEMSNDLYEAISGLYYRAGLLKKITSTLNLSARLEEEGA